MKGILALDLAWLGRDGIGLFVYTALAWSERLRGGEDAYS